jgi:hypothetical protein
MKRLLEFEEDYDFSLLGISCHSKDYRLTWSLNQHLNLEMEKNEGITYLIEEDEISFARFSYFDEEDHVQYDLLSNRSDGRELIPKVPQLDYFLKISGHLHEEVCKDLARRIPQIDFVLAVISLDIENIKSKQSLVF